MYVGIRPTIVDRFGSEQLVFPFYKGIIEFDKVEMIRSLLPSGDIFYTISMSDVTFTSDC